VEPAHTTPVHPVWHSGAKTQALETPSAVSSRHPKRADRSSKRRRASSFYFSFCFVEACKSTHSRTVHWQIHEVWSLDIWREKKIPARYGGTAVRGALHTRRRRGWPSRGPLKLPETGPQRACPLSGACGGGVRAFSRILADFPLRGERARTHRGRKAPHVTCSTPGQGH